MHFASRTTTRLFTAIALLIIASSGARPAFADDPSPKKQKCVVSANGRTLWLAVTSKDHTRLYRREIGEPFRLVRSISNKGGVLQLFGSDEDVHVLFGDRTLYRTSPTIVPEADADFPGNTLPIDAVVYGEDIFALVSPEIVAKAATRHLTTTQATQPTMQAIPATAAQDSSEETLWIIRYSNQQWTPWGRTAIPTGIQAPNLTPQIATINQTLAVLWTTEDNTKLHYQPIDPKDGTAKTPVTLSTGPISGYWAMAVNRIPTIVTISPESPTSPTLWQSASQKAFFDGECEQTPMQIQMPEGVTLGEITVAFPFNQHVGIIGPIENPDKSRDLVNYTVLSFGRAGGEPSEKSQLLGDAIGLAGEVTLVHIINTLAVPVLLVLFAIIFITRRQEIRQPALLPPGWGLSSPISRLIAFFIDLMPFAWAAAWAVNHATEIEFSTSDGFSQVFRWVLGDTDPGTSIPTIQAVIWWLSTTVMYSVYCAIIEFFTGRTIGAVIARVRVLTIIGTKPTLGQVATRNLLRILELLPPLWPLSFMVLVTAKRQRIGDIFARTVVVRHTGDGVPASQNHNASSESQDSDSDSDEK